MPSPARTIETDVCIVGAGLVGLAHAHEARRRGLSVVVLERGDRATGASVRHSGHLFFSALPSGQALETAPLARERWLDLLRRSGSWANESGTLIVVRRPEELAVIEAAASEPARHARVRSTKKIGKLTPIPIDGVLGGFQAKQDLHIDARAAAAALARLLGRDPSARVEWGTHVHDIEPGVVHAGVLRVRAEAIVVCPGADYRMLPPALWPHEGGLTVGAPRAGGLKQHRVKEPGVKEHGVKEHGVKRGRLTLSHSQMLRLAPPGARRYRQTLATGASLLAYPGFCGADAMRALRERMELETPELVERGVNLVVAQLRDGDLIVGSTTTYSDSSKTFSHERLDSLILSQVRGLLGATPAVRQRWTSTRLSLSRSSDDFLVTRPMPKVRVVQPIGPTAMAVCHQQAEAVLEELFAGPLQTDMYITVRDIRKAAGDSGGVRDHARAFGRPA